jgi:UDP-glucose 4-epimerase
MPQRVLVTGGAGFIGSHVADRFVAEGWEVTVLDDLSSGHQAQVPAAARFVRADIGSADAAALVEAGRFDVVCHLAAQIDVRRSVADPAADATRNILGTLNLMEAIRRSGHRTRVVFSSTGGALYGAFAEPPSPEATATNPGSRRWCCATATCTGLGRTRTGRPVWWRSSASACWPGSR